MKFAVLGDAPEIEPLLRAIAAAPEHEWTRLPLQHDGDAGQIAQLDGDTGAETIIVAGSDQELLKTARVAAEKGHSLLVWPLSDQDLGIVYEMSLVTAEKPITLFPIWPLRQHPLVVKLRELLDEGELGAVQYLELQRTLRPPAETPTLLTKSLADRAFLADVDLLRDLGGDYNNVTTLRTGSDDALSALTTTLSSDQAPAATWTVKTGGDNTWQLTIAGMRATAVLSGDPEAGSLTLEVEGADFSLPSQSATYDWGPDVLSAFLAAAESDAGEDHWESLQRGMELMHATNRSLRRKRTIELFFEAHSERSNFKTQMTAIGCLLIMFTLFGVILVLVGGQAGLPPLVMSILRIAVFAPLGIFLLLQLLLLLTKPASPRRESPPHTSD